MTENDKERVRRQIREAVWTAHHNADKIKEATADLPNSIDAAHRAVAALVKATALRELLDEM